MEVAQNVGTCSGAGSRGMMNASSVTSRYTPMPTSSMVRTEELRARARRL